MRITAGMIVGLIAAPKSREQILRLHLYLEAEDINQAMSYAAWHVEKREIPVAAG
jgi:uncharacterized protein (DUF433 family)